MMKRLIEESSNSLSGFYLRNTEELLDTLGKARKSDRKILLLGVTYALLDLAEKNPTDLSGHIVVETGGMKGQRKEMIREEVHDILKTGLNIKSVHSEYGMTELLSQAWSRGNSIFECPPWMKVISRDAENPLEMAVAGRTGGLNIIDLANVHSCSFIATDDLGKVYEDGSFEVTGRFDQADVRGCNLLI